MTLSACCQPKIVLPFHNIKLKLKHDSHIKDGFSSPFNLNVWPVNNYKICEGVCVTYRPRLLRSSRSGSSSRQRQQRSLFEIWQHKLPGAWVSESPGARQLLSDQSHLQWLLHEGEIHFHCDKPLKSWGLFIKVAGMALPIKSPMKR